jgi:hypothetical protein
MKPKTILRDRKGQVWEWLTSPVERCYVMRSWLGAHPADGMPITYHELVSLNTGILVEEYIEMTDFEALEAGGDPEMRRLL